MTPQNRKNHMSSFILQLCLFPWRFYLLSYHNYEIEWKDWEINMPCICSLLNRPFQQNLGMRMNRRRHVPCVPGFSCHGAHCFHRERFLAIVRIFVLLMFMLRMDQMGQWRNFFWKWHSSKMVTRGALLLFHRVSLLYRGVLLLFQRGSWLLYRPLVLWEFMHHIQTILRTALT